MGSVAVARLNGTDDLHPPPGSPDPYRAERHAGRVRDRAVLDGAAGAYARADEPVRAARARPPDAPAARVVDRYHRAERSVQYLRRLPRDDHSAVVARRQMGTDRRGAHHARDRSIVLRHYTEDVRTWISGCAGMDNRAPARHAHRSRASVREVFCADSGSAASRPGF